MRPSPAAASLLLLLACGGSETSGATAGVAGPDDLSDTVLTFTRAAGEVEVVRLASDGTFTRDAGATAGQPAGLGTWDYAPRPPGVLTLDDEPVPPEVPEGFTSVYDMVWADEASGTFTMTRTFSDGFSFDDEGDFTAQ